MRFRTQVNERIGVIVMCKFNPANQSRFIDPCMRQLIKFLNDKKIKTLSCCCGHGVYPMTIVIDCDGVAVEALSDVVIPRKKKFYRTDRKGVSYIPEAKGK